MKVLVVGSGGREHALTLSMYLSDHVEEVFCCPGNPGISQIAQCIPIQVDEFEKIANFALEQRIDLIIIGPDDPLSMGIVDYLEGKGLRVFGPRQDSAKLEWSKYFAKEFMLRRNIPTARYAAFDRREHAIAYAQSKQLPIVIKADGLAKGKGVAVVHTQEGAVGAINACFDGKFGDSGKLVIIEDFLHGEEASIFAICDGENYSLLPTAQDYKRLMDGDQGPNTGGMGAFAPNRLIDDEVLKKVEDRIIKPTIRGMREEGKPYKGFLYVGIMLDENKDPYVVEFNSRLGDPETQVVLPLLECDLFEVLWQATEGDLGDFKGRLPSTELSGSGSAVCVVMASHGYPEKATSGVQIRLRVGLSLGPNSQLVDATGEIPEENAKVLLFHSGTKLDNNRNLTTAGGRVLCVTALARTKEEAREAAYKAVDKIDFAGKQCRSDIGKGAR
jgi:phosphoribosylamine--glycine ligase